MNKKVQINQPNYTWIIEKNQNAICEEVKRLEINKNINVSDSNTISRSLIPHMLALVEHFGNATKHFLENGRAWIRYENGRIDVPRVINRYP